MKLALERMSDRRVTILSAVFFVILLPGLIIPIVTGAIDYVVARGETNSVQADLDRAVAELDEKTTHLDRILANWSALDRSGQLVDSRLQPYFKEFFIDKELENLAVDALIIVDDAETSNYWVNRSSGNGERPDLPFKIDRLLEQYPLLRESRGQDNRQAGLVIVDGQAMLAVSQTGASSRPGKTMILLVYLTDHMLGELSKTIQKDVQIQVAGERTWESFFDDASLIKAEQNSFFLRRNSLDVMTGYRQLLDLNGDPAALLQLTGTRDLATMGRKVGTAFAVLAIVLGILLYLLIHPLILAYIRSLRTNRESHERLRAVVQQTSEAILLVDGDMQVLDANPASQNLLGIHREGNTRVCLTDLVTIEEELNPQVLDHISQNGDIIETRCVRQDGVTLDVEISASRIHYLNLDTFSLILRDITSRKMSESALRASEERYQLATRGANDGLWDWNLMTNEVYFSARWKIMLGYEDDEIGSNPSEWIERIHPDDSLAFQTQLSDHLKNGTSHFQCEHRLLHKDGEWRWVLARGVAVWSQEGYANRIAGSLTDIQRQKEIEEQLRHDALHDDLTGLANRTVIIDRLRHANERKRRRPGMTFALLFLDFDRFKQVNDTLGHHIGDMVLIESARRLERGLRSVDAVSRLTGPETVARIAGDEFVLLLEDLSTPQDAMGVAERILRMIAEPIHIDGIEVTLSASIGLVVPDAPYENPEDIIRDADIAMYRAKQRGGASIVQFSQDMYEHALERIQTEIELRRAVIRGEFEVHYQPIYSLDGDRLAGFEALVRWNHPQRGLLMPAHFIDVAEETGLIIPIGYFVLQEACRQMQNWRDNLQISQDLVMSVNLSTRQLSSSELVGHVSQILEDTGFDPHQLWLEVTENTLIQNLADVRQQMEDLRELGIRIKIDDFGTGYSSLSYLKNLPVDGFKIDRSFVMDLENSGQQLIKTLVALGHDLGLAEVAEGVETEFQRDYLRSINCDYAQGYLMSKPISAAAIQASILAKTPIDA